MFKTHWLLGEMGNKPRFPVSGSIIGLVPAKKCQVFIIGNSWEPAQLDKFFSSIILISK